MKLNQNKKGNKEILKKIHDRGFLIEIETIKILEEEGWDTFPQEPYMDSDKKEMRSIDIVARKTRHDLESPLFDTFQMVLCVECKKESKDMWIFYRRKKGREFHHPSLLIKEVCYPKKSISVYDMGLRFQKSHYFQDEEAHVAVNYTHLSGKDTFFEAQNQVLKALHYQMQTDRELLLKLKLTGKHSLVLFYPIIILDGRMMEYRLEKGKEVLNDINHTFYLTNRKIGVEQSFNLFCIDVLKRPFFSQFIEILNREFEEIIEEILLR